MFNLFPWQNELLSSRLQMEVSSFLFLSTMFISGMLFLTKSLSYYRKVRNKQLEPSNEEPWECSRLNVVRLQLGLPRANMRIIKIQNGAWILFCSRIRIHSLYPSIPESGISLDGWWKLLDQKGKGWKSYPTCKLKREPATGLYTYADRTHAFWVRGKDCLLITT